MVKKNRWAWLFIFLTIALGIEVCASLLTVSSVKTWYITLHKPSWTPPNYIFGPVWTILYVSIAFSGWLICMAKTRISKKIAFFYYGLQLTFNLLWSYLFFYLKSPHMALIDMFLLLGALTATICSFFKISQWASVLLLPYFIWLLYAAALNISICFSN